VKAVDKLTIINSIVLMQYNTVYDRRFSALWRGSNVKLFIAFGITDYMRKKPQLCLKKSCGPSRKWFFSCF